MAEASGAVVHEADGSITRYADVAVTGDTIERLMLEVFRDHWAEIFAGPIIEGAAYEIRFTAPPTCRCSMAISPSTPAPGTSISASTTTGARRRPSRPGCAAWDGPRSSTPTAAPVCPARWGLRLWNGRGEQMVTVFFPNPWLDEAGERVREARWDRTALWETLRRRYAARRMRAARAGAGARAAARCAGPTRTRSRSRPIAPAPPRAPTPSAAAPCSSRPASPYLTERAGGAPTERRFRIEAGLRAGVTERLELRIEGFPFVRVRGADDDSGAGDFLVGGKIASSTPSPTHGCRRSACSHS